MTWEENMRKRHENETWEEDYRKDKRRTHKNKWVILKSCNKLWLMIIGNCYQQVYMMIDWLINCHQIVLIIDYDW